MQNMFPLVEIYRQYDKLHSLQMGISSPPVLLFPAHLTILGQYPTLTPFPGLSRTRIVLVLETEA